MRDIASKPNKFSCTAPPPKYHRSIRVLEEIRRLFSHPGQCRWRPEGRHYPVHLPDHR
uniref:Uncharacterized protein n=1 Tax=Arundo donax TaxID=35708 RepID=A0A0A9G2I9_ARUDO